MSERNGKCPACEGKGVLIDLDETGGNYTYIECGTCDGQGYWGGAFPPGAVDMPLPRNLYGIK